MNLPDWTIQQDQDTKGWHAGGSGPVMMSVDAPGTLVKLRAVNSAAGEFACWLVGELDGVRCYVVERDGLGHILMTKEVLYPSVGGGVMAGKSNGGA